jgi:hypothetical protein
MDTVQKQNSSKCITPSSEPFRIDLSTYTRINGVISQNPVILTAADITRSASYFCCSSADCSNNSCNKALVLRGKERTYAVLPHRVPKGDRAEARTAGSQMNSCLDRTRISRTGWLTFHNGNDNYRHVETERGSSGIARNFEYVPRPDGLPNVYHISTFSFISGRCILNSVQEQRKKEGRRRTINEVIKGKTEWGGKENGINLKKKERKRDWYWSLNDAFWAVLLL